MLSRLIALILIIVISPAMLIIFIISFIELGTNIFFFQERVGKNNKLFKLYKLRTMRLDTPDKIPTRDFKNPGLYITFFGKYLRKYSIDEIPQLFNVLNGDMVFIGPRPSLENEKELNDLRKKNNIHILKPGITGWAQINGRDEISVEKKVELELFYLNKKSLLVDLKILIFTVYTVLKTRGVSH